jgi:glucose/arabinose dehydrogenase
MTRPRKTSAPRSAHPRRARRVAVAAVVTALVLAGASCSIDDGGGPEAPSSTTGATATPPTGSGSGSGSDGTAEPTEPAPPVELPEPTEVATGLDVPWGIAFRPDGSALVAERDTGRILRLAPGAGTATGPAPATPTPVATVPGVAAAGEGGLLGLAASPTYADDELVYAYLTTAEDNRVVRFRLDDPAGAEVVVDGIERAAIHDGGRIAFGPDGLLYVATGDAARGGLAQDQASLNGKVLRLEPDGSVPADNPTPGSPVYTSGHRNVQGLAWDDDGRLWAAELGENRWDELNLLEPGANHGWPEVEGEGGADQGFTDPVVTWETSEASPSGLAHWQGSLYVAGLRGERLWQVPLVAGSGSGTGPLVGEPVAQLDGAFGRLRTVVVAPDGALWVATGNTDGRGSPRPGDDRILRFAPT